MTGHVLCRESASPRPLIPISPQPVILRCSRLFARASKDDGRGVAARLTSRPQALALDALVEVGDELAVTVEQEGRPALAGADHLLGGLAPARVGNLRID